MPRHLSAGAPPAHRAPGPAVRRPTVPSAAARHRAEVVVRRRQVEAAHLRSQIAAAEAAAVALDADGLEVAPLARVKRSRFAFALAVSVAALPVIALDNMTATAEGNDTRLEAAGNVEESTSSESSESTVPWTAPSSTTTEAPTTTAAPETTTTEAPPTTEAVIEALRAPAPTTPPPPPTTQAPPPPGPGTGDPNDPATWDRLAQCEASGNWAMSSGNGYYGGLQFSLATWQSVGGTGYPHQNSKAEQINRGKILQARSGWGQWPSCSRKLGYL